MRPALNIPFSSFIIEMMLGKPLRPCFGLVVLVAAVGIGACSGLSPRSFVAHDGGLDGGDGGAAADGGTDGGADAGTGADAGQEVDAGNDAGGIEDAGGESRLDAGFDAGVIVDSGVPPAIGGRILATTSPIMNQNNKMLIVTYSYMSSACERINSSSFALSPTPLTTWGQGDPCNKTSAQDTIFPNGSHIVTFAIHAQDDIQAERTTSVIAVVDGGDATVTATGSTLSD